jgi:hypothetical protein
MKDKLLLLSIFLKLQLYSQGISNTFDYGVGCRLTADFTYSFNHKQKLWFNWKLALTNGLAYNLNYYTVYYYRPTIHVDYTVLQGGCGSNDLDAFRQGKVFKRVFSSFIAITIHPLHYANNFNADMNTQNFLTKPFYYFDDVNYPVLTNPFTTSVSFGTTFLYNINAKGWQRIGNLSLSHRNVQFIYSNDGPPFALRGLTGDREDRWFTGQGLINYYNENWRLSNWELS